MIIFFIYVNILGARFRNVLQISEKTNSILPQRNTKTPLTKTKINGERKKRSNQRNN